jgi:hypothetical protein
MVSLGISLVGSAVVSIAMFACSSDNKSSSTDAGNGATTGGATSTGGSASSTGGSTTTGGSTGSGGTTALPDAAMLYPCYSQPPHDPGGSAAVGAACCGGLGTCGLASSLTGPAASSYAHDSCKASSGADDLKCAPTPASLSDAGTAGIFDTCQADFGGGIMLEGRCLPSCFIQGNPQASLLSQGSCAAADAGGGPQVCAPCYNPIDGTETGACSQKPGDKPKQAAPATFKGCGASDGGAPLGICVPAESVQRSGNAAAALLQQDDCAAKGDLCVPKLKADNLNSCFVKCQTASTTLSSFGAQYNDGACVPKYIVGDTQGATALAALVQSTCGQGELCAPCLNPLMSGMTTGACQ